MKSLLGLIKKIVSSIVLLSVANTLHMYGAAEPIKRLHLIPISYNHQTHEYSVLLRKLADYREWTDFAMTTDNLLNVDNVAEYMNHFSAQTFGVYSPDTAPLTRSPRAFTYEGRPVDDTSQDGFIFIEIPFIRGQRLFAEGLKNAPGANFLWAPISSIMDYPEGGSYGIYKGELYPINTHYLRFLKLMLPQLPAPTQPKTAATGTTATKRLNVIPVSYNPQNHEFSVFLVKPNAQRDYRAFQIAVSSLVAPIDPAVYMQQLSEQTYGAYSPNLRPSTRSNKIFNIEGQPVKPETDEGYMYIEIPYIRGLDIWREARKSLGQGPHMDYNWMPRSVILRAAENQRVEGYHGPIESSLLKTLKATLPLLKRQGEKFILTQYEKEASEECPVCLESKDFKELPCGHKVCTECLAEIEEKARCENVQLLCPVCRAPIHQKPS